MASSIIFVVARPGIDDECVVLLVGDDAHRRRLQVVGAAGALEARLERRLAVAQAAGLPPGRRRLRAGSRRQAGTGAGRRQPGAETARGRTGCRARSRQAAGAARTARGVHVVLLRAHVDQLHAGRDLRLDRAHRARRQQLRQHRGEIGGAAVLHVVFEDPRRGLVVAVIEPVDPGLDLAQISLVRRDDEDRVEALDGEDAHQPGQGARAAFAEDRVELAGDVLGVADP
jgi:hypothetical protein